MAGLVLLAVEGSALALFSSAISSIISPEVASLLMAVFVHGLVPACCCVVAYYYNDLYDLAKVRTFGEFLRGLPQALVVSALMLAWIAWVIPGADHGLGPIAFAASILTVLAALTLPLRWLAYRVLARRATSEPVVIVGQNPVAQKLIEAIEEERHFRYTIVGVADDPEPADEEPPGPPPAPEPLLLRYPFVTPAAQLCELVRETQARRVIVALPDRRESVPVRYLLELRSRGVTLEDGIPLFERITGKLPVDWMPPSFLIFSPSFRRPLLDRALRRGLSVAIAGAGLLVSWPVMLLTALAVRLDSPGSALFRQDRVGRDGRTFRLLKFRTMLDRPAGSAGGSAASDQTRITRVGRWLRKFRLDELPQFWNVLRGDMDVVGPRPEIPEKVEALCQRVPYFSLRQLVRPGITGWAQVRSGYAESVAEHKDKLCYDLFYIRNASLWFDLRILVDTVKVVLLGRERVAQAVPAAPGVPRRELRLEGSLAPVRFQTLPEDRSRAV